MQVFSHRPALRWLAPFVVVVAVAGASLVGTRAVADPGLPSISAQQLLTRVATAQPDGLSGTVSQTADLGLPSLGQSGPGSEFSDLVSGTHTLHVAYAAPDRARVAVNGEFGESDLITDGTDQWLWSSSKNEVVHHTVAAGATRPSRPSGAPSTPADAVREALAAITPTTEVSVATNTTVAGRAAYQLVLTPKDVGTLVDSVRVAVDGSTFTPLRVELLAKGVTGPVFSTAFTDVDFAVPAAAEFTFTPPEGAKVTQAKGDHAIAAEHRAEHRGQHGKVEHGKAEHATPEVVGTGWSTVLVADAGTDAVDSLDQGGQSAQVLQSLPKVSGAWGSGRLLRGTAFSAVLTDDGRVAVGAVTPDVLYRALG